MTKKLIIITSLLIFSWNPAYSKGVPTIGHIAGEKFTVRILLGKRGKQNKTITVILGYKGKVQEIKYEGEKVGHAVLWDLNGDGNDEILFNYYEDGRLSDLGLIGYQGGQFKSLEADYWGPDFELVPFGKKTLVASKVGDGGKFYYFGHLSELDGDKLVETNSADAWENVIQNVYSKWLERADSGLAKSRFNYYMYMACRKAELDDKAEEYYGKSSKEMPSEKRMLIYYTGGFQDADPDALDDLGVSIDQIGDFAKKFQIQLKENTKKDPEDPSCTYALVSGERVKRLDGIETGPDLAEDCKKFFGLK